MKMKNKLVVAGIVLSVGMFAFGTVLSALVYHVTERKEQIKVMYAEEIDSHFDNLQYRVKLATDPYTQESIERLEAETNNYLHQKLQDNFQSREQEKLDEITDATDSAIEEVKEYIDQYIQDKNEEFEDIF